MLYLLDANTLITGENDPYPLTRVPEFWDWLIQMGTNVTIKIPIEIYDEIVVGNGPLVDWLKQSDTAGALIFNETAQPSLVNHVTLTGYGNLNDQEIEIVGRDLFLISYAYTDLGRRTVVTFEVSKPTRQRHNRHIPDVCRDFGIPTCTLYQLNKLLDFTTSWRP